ncbi:DedA family protein [Streptomyces sp. NPDC005492]|uniref:DedA family protein n=1 Tax=Streptomyces sp. NPDC005492 TaxID=3156883 RepID=UPI0033A68593
MLLVVIPAGYLAISAAQSRNEAAARKRRAERAGLVHDMPSAVERGVYQVPIPTHANAVAFFEANTWEKDSLYVQFTTTPAGLNGLFTRLGTRTAPRSRHHHPSRPPAAGATARPARYPPFQRRSAMTAPAPPLPGVFADLAPLLDHWGYAAVGGLLFLEDFGVPVPGETVLIAAAVYAGAGRLNVLALAVIAVLAAVVGDNVGYLIGRYGGHRLVTRYGRYVLLTPARVAKAEAFFARNGGKVITVSRFIEGLRQANGIIAGLSEMPWRRFLAFNMLGAVLWGGVSG